MHWSAGKQWHLCAECQARSSELPLIDLRIWNQFSTVTCSRFPSLVINATFCLLVAWCLRVRQLPLTLDEDSWTLLWLLSIFTQYLGLQILHEIWNIHQSQTHKQFLYQFQAKKVWDFVLFFISSVAGVVAIDYDITVQASFCIIWV